MYLILPPYIAQVQDYEFQQQSLLKSSLNPLSRGLATASGSRLQAAVGGVSSTKAPPTAPARFGLASTSQSRTVTPTGARLQVNKNYVIKYYSFQKVHGVKFA